MEPQELSSKEKALEKDEDALNRLGKKAVLKEVYLSLDPGVQLHGFDHLGRVLDVGLVSGNLPSPQLTLISLFLVGLQNGGPAGVIYGFIIVWFGTMSVFMVLSELVSIAPTSGGQYHWVAMLAPRSSRKVLSYVSGWLTICGWLGSLGSGGYLTGSLIQGLVILTRPKYVPENWHGTLLYWAVMLFAVIINVGAGWLLPRFEGLLLFLHILGFFGIMIPLLTMGPVGNAHDVFTTFLNMGGWDSQGLSFCIGLMGSVFAFVGGDGTIHMSEEIQNAAVAVPRSIMTGILINGSLGFAMVLTVLFRAGDRLNEP